jgi:hypothetical protein
MGKPIQTVVAGAVLFSAVSAFAVTGGPAVVLLADKPTSQAVAHDPVHEVRRVMAQGADRALGKNAVAGVLDLVNKADRDRLSKQIDKGDEKAYQAEADKVQKMWKDKYGKPFSAEGHVNDLGDLNATISGEGKDQTAVVNFPAEPGEKAYSLHLMREKNGYWRIQLPDTFDGDHFYANLLKSVQTVGAEKDKLPGAVDKAYPRVTTQLLQEMAFPAEAAKKK